MTEPCSHCGRERQSAEAAAYGTVCEDCHVGEYPASVRGVGNRACPTSLKLSWAGSDRRRRGKSVDASK